MSKSKRQPVINDGPRNEKKGLKYNRAVRRVTKKKVKFHNELLDDEVIPDPKEIFDDWNYSDYRFDLRFGDEETAKKWSRK